MNTINKTLICSAVLAATITTYVLAEDATDHAGHDHAAHDHPPAAAKPDEHAGHDHASETHTDEVTLTPESQKQNGVMISQAKKQVLDGAFVSPARATFNGDAMAHVGSAVAGRASELKVKLGDTIKQGDLLVVVDSPELGESQSDFLLKRTAVESARPAVKLARDAYDRAKQLLDQNQSIAAAEVQKREAELRTAEASLRAAEAAVTAAENKLHLYGMNQADVTELAKTGEIVPKYRVLAPIGGEVIEREVTLGELVRPDRDALLIIADLSTIWVIADVPEAKIGDVAVGSSATVNVVALKGGSLQGKVTYIAPALDPNTRTAKVRIELTDPSGVLRPGMFAQATILPQTSAAAAVLAIPEEAVQTVEGGPAIFVPVADEPNTFAKRPVRISKPIGGMVQVITGLEENESFVSSGSFILKAELGKAGAAHEH